MAVMAFQRIAFLSFSLSAEARLLMRMLTNRIQRVPPATPVTEYHCTQVVAVENTLPRLSQGHLADQ